jgi:hypothetical protein
MYTRIKECRIFLSRITAQALEMIADENGHKGNYDLWYYGMF